MKKYLTLFNSHAEYEQYVSGNFEKPNVSHCVQEDDVHYNPYIKPFFCKLTLNNHSIVEIEGSGQLTSAMTKEYSATCISAEIGELCTALAGNVFNGMKHLTSATISDSVKFIMSSAFNGCDSLINVSIGSGVTYIGDSAFYNCSGLTSINIPSGVTKIGNSTFYGCSGLTSITIPISVTSIGY